MGPDPRRIEPIGSERGSSDEWDDDLIIGTCEERLRRCEHELSQATYSLGVHEALAEAEMGGVDRDRRIVDGATRLIHAWWDGGTDDLRFRRELADLATLIPLLEDYAPSQS